MVKKRKLLDLVRDVIRVKNNSYKAGKAYVHWINRYILYHQKRQPEALGHNKVETFLIHPSFAGSGL